MSDFEWLLTDFFMVVEGVCITDEPCENDGICETRDGVTYTCDCSLTDYTGDNCELGKHNESFMIGNSGYTLPGGIQILYPFCIQIMYVQA